MTLGETEGQARNQIGPPKRVKHGFLRYCVKHGGWLLAGERADRSGSLGYNPKARVLVLLTTSPGFGLVQRGGRTLTVGSRARAFRGARRIGRAGELRILRRGNIVAAIAHHRVAYLGAYDKRAIHAKRRLLGYLRRAI